MTRILAATILLISTAHAQLWTVRERLLGDMGGLRTTAEEHGINFELTYTGEVFQNTTGGIKTGGQYRQDLSLTVELNTSDAGLWDNGEFFSHIQFQDGSGITEKYVGDFQTLSNIDADNYFQVTELWYKHFFSDESLWLKVGKMDANADFAFVEFGGEFIGSSPGFAPSIPLVTFPDADWGAVLGIRKSERFTMNLGIYQGRNNGSRSIGNTLDDLHGPMIMIEPAFHYTAAGKPGHLRVGYWYHGDDFERFDGNGVEIGTDGFYLSWDQSLSEEEGFGVFVNLGFSDKSVIEAQNYFGAGIQYTGKVLYSENDIVGLGIFHVDFSDEAGFDEDSETAIELYYKMQATRWVSIKPDVQFILNPGGSIHNDALALGLRFEITF